MTNEEMDFNKANEIVSTLKYDYLRKLPAYRVNEIRSRIAEALRQKDEVIVEWMNVAHHHEAKISALEKEIERVQILMQEEINKKDEELFFKKQEISALEDRINRLMVTCRS